jgi:hypothetical protein
MRSRASNISCTSHRFLRASVTAALAGALVGSPFMSTAMARAATVHAVGAAAVGNVYGGFTSQHDPVVLELSANRRHVGRMAAALDLTCTSGGGFTAAPQLGPLPVTKSGRFSRTLGPVTQRNDDGTTTDYSEHMTGKLNHAKTKISGTWSLKGVDHDATGAVTDTCDSGTVTWTAKQ